jgi:hypothetical protein
MQVVLNQLFGSEPEKETKKKKTSKSDKKEAKSSPKKEKKVKKEKKAKEPKEKKERKPKVAKPAPEGTRKSARGRPKKNTTANNNNSNNNNKSNNASDVGLDLVRAEDVQESTIKIETSMEIDPTAAKTDVEELEEVEEEPSAKANRSSPRKGTIIEKASPKRSPSARTKRT